MTIDKDAATTAQPRIFTRADRVTEVLINIHLPKLYPDFAPFGFAFRMELSREAKERREKFLALSAVEQMDKGKAQAIDEVADLLIREPTGFGDFPVDERPLRERAVEYFSSDEQMMAIAEAANTVYYNTVLPREFRP